MDQQELDNRFKYHAPTKEQVEIYGEIRNQFRGLAEKLNAWLPESREKSLAITKLEEAVMHSNSCIARRT